MRAAGELVVEIGRGVGDDTDGEVEASDGLRGDVVCGRRRRKGGGGGHGVGGTQLATIKEEEEAFQWKECLLVWCGEGEEAIVGLRRATSGVSLFTYQVQVAKHS